MFSIRSTEIRNEAGETVALFHVQDDNKGTALLHVCEKGLPSIRQKMAEINNRDGYPNEEVLAGDNDNPQVITFLITHPYNFNCIVMDFPRIMRSWLSG